MAKNKRGAWSHEESLRLQAELPDPNPSGLCFCGCGQETPIAKVTMRSRGVVRGKHMRYRQGHAGGKRKRELGEKKISEAGYVLVYQPDHPRSNMGWVFEHILVMEAALGRFLTDTERVHHEDRVRTNNALGNLKLLATQSDHRKLHIAEDEPHWSRAHPELSGCKQCGTSDSPHCAQGLCKRCYSAQGKQPTWAKRGGYDECQFCGRNDVPHYGRGYCKKCYMHLFFSNALPATTRTGSRSKH